MRKIVIVTPDDTLGSLSVMKLDIEGYTGEGRERMANIFNDLTNTLGGLLAQMISDPNMCLEAIDQVIIPQLKALVKGHAVGAVSAIPFTDQEIEEGCPMMDFANRGDKRTKEELVQELIKGLSIPKKGGDA